MSVASEGAGGRQDESAAFGRWPETIVGAAGDRQWFESLLGKACRVLLHSDQTRGRLSQIEVRANPGERMPSLRHGDTDLLINVLDGAFLLASDGEERLLAPGTFAAIPRGATHRWRAVRAGSRALLTFSPGGIEALLRACSSQRYGDLPNLARTFGTEIGDVDDP